MIARWMLLIMVWLGLANLCPAAPIDQTEILDLFSRGKEFFRQANELEAGDSGRARELYHKAALRFERIAREGGIHNGRLYYNIGNAYFRMQNTGQAILNYRRAELFIPDDANLRQNLEYARSRRIDRVEEKERTKILKTLFFWHYDFAPKTRLLLLVVFSAAFWLVALGKLFWRRAALNWAMVVFGLIALMSVGSLATDMVADTYDKPGVILAPEVVARKGDSTTYQPSFQDPLHAGTEFYLREPRRDWWHIELADGRRCWIPATSAKLVKHLAAD